MTLLFNSLLAAVQDTGTGVVVEAPANTGIFDLMDGGFIMYPILGCGVLVLGISVWTATRLWGRDVDLGPRTRAAVDSVLFWGGFSVVLGVLGTLVGIMVAARAIEAVGEVHASLVWGGVRVALITTVTGVLILSAASLLWFALRLRYRKLAAPA